MNFSLFGVCTGLEGNIGCQVFGGGGGGGLEKVNLTWQ